MKQLLNTLFVMTEDVYLTLEGENTVAKKGQDSIARYPLHTLSNIITFTYAGASPALMGACAERNIGLSFCTPNGRFLARTTGPSQGNVLLRRKQYHEADDKEASCQIVRNMISGKLFNSRWVLERLTRDHPDRIDKDAVKKAADIINAQQKSVQQAVSIDEIRGYEGVAAAGYFSVFDQMILRDKESFFFKERSRRPPLDNTNTMLSFAYSLLANECASALESVGLDAYVGFMHQDRPGRESLALDLMEELRPVMADRFVLTLINNRIIQRDHFIKEEQGAVRFTDQGRRQFVKAWQEKKKEQIMHPFLKEKIAWGLVPYVQALLLSRYLRGDLDGYPAFLWK